MGIVNTLGPVAFCMWDLLFCVLCRCRTFYSYTVDCRSPTSSPASLPPCRLKASAAHRARTGTTTDRIRTIVEAKDKHNFTISVFTFRLACHMPARCPSKTQGTRTCLNAFRSHACGHVGLRHLSLHRSMTVGAKLHDCTCRCERRTPTSTTSGSQFDLVRSMHRPHSVQDALSPSPAATPSQPYRIPSSWQCRLRVCAVHATGRWCSPSVADGGAHHRWPSSVRGGTPKAIETAGAW